ncbi:DUF6355 family natural product biosynthesis protein [Kutzneria sp. CA-103260]|uniref:DUF6355 family natural product biosynthesis protein n=1 Tax=Kutzneria sp. CA-103260 TaxID=2802641 RepID=UPI001BACA33F|nr:DUF6355 family natural product biosynthesis protein [Kutzneria sp. CA-103260]
MPQSAPCGFYTEWQLGLDEAYYHNCSGSSAYVKVDRPFLPDDYLCVNGYKTVGLGQYPDDVRGTTLLGAICKV